MTPSSHNEAHPEKCWLQITSGQGPSECALAVAKLVHKLQRNAQKQTTQKADLSLALIHCVAGREKGTFASALLSCSGKEAYHFAHPWHGTHQWICQSPFRPHHKRKNWFIGASLLVPPELASTQVKLSDIHFETLRSSGPGGQHANKTDSAVRARHIPSGFVVLAQEERSQHMNKKLALARLETMLSSRHETQKADLDFTLWMQHKELERGNPVKIFRGLKFQETKP